MRALVVAGLGLMVSRRGRSRNRHSPCTAVSGRMGGPGRGIFDLSDVPNSARLEPGFQEFQMIAEAEHRHEIAGHPGKILITGYQTRGRMGLLDEAIAVAAASDAPAAIAAVRQLGILVGDGKLPHPGSEQMLESYYSASLCSFAQVSFDYQRIADPAYNRERGPVSVFAVRVHAQF